MLRPSVANCIGSVKILVKSSCVIVSIKFISNQEHSESADVRQGTLIRITRNIFFMDPDSDLDYSQNLITCSLSHLRHILKSSSKSVHNFLRYLSLKLHFMDPEDPDSDPDHSQN